MTLDLKEICDQALATKGFQPKNGVTFCNLGVQLIASLMGCSEFEGMMANDIYRIMVENLSGKWSKADGSDATIWALSNGLAVAAMSSQRLGEEHGHVCVIHPAGMQRSNSLGHDVPMVANIGATVGIMRSTQAFPISKGEAEYFIYAG